MSAQAAIPGGAAGAARPRLPMPVLLAYGVTGLPVAALLLPLYVHLPAFYADGLGLGFGAVGAALLLARLWDVATDPLIGSLSDRLATRWGRRRPWLLAGTPVVAISAWLLFVPPAGAGVLHLLFASMALYLGLTMILLPYSAWGAELSGDYHERSRITAARETFVVVGTMLAAALPAWLAADPRGAVAALAWMPLVVLPLCVAITCLVVPEAATAARRAIGWRKGWALLARNRAFRQLILAYLLNGVANGLPATLFLLYVEFVLGRPDLAGPLLLVYFLSGIAGVPLWLWLSRRHGKHPVWIGAMLWACSVFVWVPLLGAGDVAWFAAVCVLTGLALGADLVLPPSMQADVVDVDTAMGGGQRAGLYFALWGVATKLALALAVGIAFPLLDLAGFEGGQAAAPAGAGTAILAALYSLAPVAFKLAAVAAVWRFPISAGHHAQIRARMAAQAASAHPAGRSCG